MRRFRPPARLVVAAVLLAGLAVVGPGAGGQPPLKKVDQEFAGEGQVKAGAHKVRMEVGKLYLIQVDTTGFKPNVVMRPAGFLNTGEEHVNGQQFRAYVLPRETRDHRLTVLPSDDDDSEGELQGYSVTVTPIPMAKEPLVNEAGRLALNDPVYQNPAGGGAPGPHKAFVANFKAGQVYIITCDSEDHQNLDPYLQVEGPGGKIAAEDDDGGGYPNCRIVYRPKRGGEHRLIVTAVGRGQGAFNLKVITTVAGAGKQ